MNNEKVSRRSSTTVTYSASRTTAKVFGILAGLGGITHGIGEVLQGNVAPSGVIINSWTQGPIATNMGGEPGMTVIPNLLLTGVMCLVVGLSIIGWSVGLTRWKRGGLVLVLLSIALLLTGGGFGPPLIGLLAGVAGLQADRARGDSADIGGFRRLAARSWPWLFGISAASGFLLVVGSVVLVYTINLNVPDFFLMNFFFTVASLLVTIVAAKAYDTNQ